MSQDPGGGDRVMLAEAAAQGLGQVREATEVSLIPASCKTFSSRPIPADRTSACVRR